MFIIFTTGLPVDAILLRYTSRVTLAVAKALLKLGIIMQNTDA
jgi:hypothetical protein